MWLPRGVETFFNKIALSLSAIQKVLEKQEDTVREAYKTAEVSSEDKPGVIARIATAIESANADIETYEKPQRNKEYGLQRWTVGASMATAIFTFAAFAAAAFYACIANQQLGKMNDTYEEMRWQTYYSCLNAQAAQEAFSQLQISAADTHTATAATIQQAAAGVESQRAYVSFEFRFPAENEVFNNQLDIPFALKNEGKSATRDLNPWFTTVLLRDDEPLTFTQKLYRVTTPKFHLLAGEEVPSPPDPKYPHFSPPTPYILVYDAKGETIAGTSQTAINFLHAASSDMVFVYGRFEYSDFAGVHKVRFCHAVYATQPRASHHATTKEETCESHNGQEDSYSGMPRMSKPVTTTQGENLPVCKKPGE
jgi:hypothetical protein